MIATIRPCSGTPMAPYIYFGPKAPAGKQASWMYTASGKTFFPAMRFYDPDKPLFDRTWKLPDIEAMN